jgi:hypothetical protein
MDQNRFTTIREVVNKARMIGNIPEIKDPACVQLCINGMKDLSLFALPHKQVVKLDVDSMGRIYLPKDYLMFLAVGVPLNGYLYTFTRNNSIVQTTTETYSYEAFDTAYGEGQEIPFSMFYQYGQPGGINETYFVINERRGFIQLTSFTGSQATLHYVSSGISDNPEGVEIPKTAEEALIAYILWMVVAYDVTIPLAERRERERLYGEALKDIALIYAPTAQEIMDHFYSTTYQTIKR